MKTDLDQDRYFHPSTIHPSLKGAYWNLDMIVTDLTHSCSMILRRICICAMCPTDKIDTCGRLHHDRDLNQDYNIDTGNFAHSF